MGWAARRMGLSAPPTAADRDAYQLERIRETVAHARAKSPFYRDRRKWPEALPATFAEVAHLPFTWPEDLTRNDPSLIAVPRSTVARMVSLTTSGTTGQPKRMAFTADDVDDTIDYFHHGMAQFTRPGDRVGILFPADRPGSIGQDLVEASRRLGANPLPMPRPPSDSVAETLLSWVRDTQPTVLFGPPVPLLAAARLSYVDGGPIPAIRAALVSSDTAPNALIQALGALWGCTVFNHWGMTETGYGGALDCPHHTGAHVRETDLFLEIVDPLSGTPRPPGEDGEIVLTALRRTALPLIRYRTGDLGRLVETPCPCGSVFRRLVGLGRRIGDAPLLPSGDVLSRVDLDEALFPLEAVTDYTAHLEEGTPSTLRITVAAPQPFRGPALEPSIRQRLRDNPKTGPLLDTDAIRLEIKDADAPLLVHEGKRRVTRRRQGPWPQAVLFDLDGTLVHTLPAVQATLNETLSAFGQPPLAPEVVARLIGGGARALIERAVEEHEETLSSDDRDAMVAHYVAHYPDREDTMSTLLPGATESLRLTAREGRTVAIVTNKRTREARRLVDRLGLAPWVSTVIGGDTSLSNKPDPDTLLLTCRRLGVEVAETLFVGDGPEDLAATQAIGMPFVLVDQDARGDHPPPPGTATIATLADLPSSIRKYENMLRSSSANLSRKSSDPWGGLGQGTGLLSRDGRDDLPEINRKTTRKSRATRPMTQSETEERPNTEHGPPPFPHAAETVSMASDSSPTTPSGGVITARHRFQDGSDGLEGLSAPILQSWQRCSTQGLHMDMDARRNLELPSRQALRDLIESNEPLVQAAWGEVEALRQDLGRESGLVILTDATGQILMRVGDDAFARDADRLTLSSGASWAEDIIGTNAIGTALVEARPLSILGAEHFIASNSVLNCSAAPIFDPRGRIIGALDLSTPTRVTHNHLLALVSRAVEQIERSLFERQCGQWECMRLHTNPYLVGGPHEGLLAFDGDRLVGANRNAVSLLGLAWSAIGDARFNELFSVQHGSVTRQASSDECIVQTTQGQTLFARLEAKPKTVPRTGDGLDDGDAASFIRSAEPSEPARPPHEILDTLPDGPTTSRPRRRKVQRGTLIHGAEEKDISGEAMLIMASGEARCFTSFEGKELTLFTLGAGDAMPLRNHIQVEIQKEGELYLLQHATFDRLLRTHPDFALSVMPVIKHLLRKSIDIIEDVAFHSVKYRLVRMVVDLAERTGRTTARGVVIDMRSSGENLAMRVGASRQTVSTVMAGMVRAGTLKRLGGGAILIPDLDRLKADLEDLR